MLTPSADDRLPQRESVIDDTIPAELEPLDQRLLMLGATWRNHPAVTRLASYAQKLPPDLPALDGTEITPDLATSEASAKGNAPVEENTMSWRNTGTHRLSPKAQAVLASVAAVLIVGLLAATFAVFSHRSTPKVGAQATATLPASTATATSPATRSWSPLPNLSSTTTFALAAPAIAPSDPQIVYRVTDSPHLALQRTANGGATWQTYSLPVSNAHNFMQVYVSPLNPNVVVLHTDGWASQQSFCNYQAQSWIRTTSGKVSTGSLVALSSQVPAGPFLPCSQFLSTNGGRSWIQSPVFFDSARILTAGGESAGIFMVQGQRLYTYEGFTCQAGYTGICGGGLLVSQNGGMSWGPAPTPSGSFCGIGMAPTGTVMFAITSPQCGQGNVPSDNAIWRSDDGGEHWTPVSHLQFSAVDSLRVVLNPATGTPTVFLTASNLANVNTTDIKSSTTVQMSQDGGQTWSAVPTEGIPAGWSAIDVVAETSDGSAIALFGPAGSSGADLYSLLPGASSWLPVASTPPSTPAMYLVTSAPGAAGADSLWAVSVSLATVGGAPYTSKVYRLKL
jgi:hypothetical protein